MAYKTPGSLDFSLGQMGRFVCYCEHCHKKVVMLPEDFENLRNDLRATKQKQNLRVYAKKLLTNLAEGL